MIIGILVADELENQVTQRYGSYAVMFEKLLSEIDDRLEFRSYQVTQGQYPAEFDECDVYLITGSKYSCYEELEWINRLKQFVVDCYECNKKLIGICFGHQLVAQALGGEVQESVDGWGVGLTCSDVLLAPDWLVPEKKHFNLLVSHQDQVTQLPPQAELIAGNDFCPVACYQIEHSILAFQGHPEFNREYLQHILTKRRQLIGEKAYQYAIKSLQQHVDQEVVAKWILQFIEN